MMENNKTTKPPTHDASNSLGPPSPDDAKEALSIAEQASQAGMQRGLYSRSFAAAASIWTGGIAAMIGLGWPIWFLIMVAGLIAGAIYKSKRGAWVQEAHSQREFWTFVVPLALLLCAIAFAGIAGNSAYGLVWAPIASGTFIAIGLYTIMELTHRKTRAQHAVSATGGNR